MEIIFQCGAWLEGVGIDVVYVVCTFTITNYRQVYGLVMNVTERFLFEVSVCHCQKGGFSICV